MGSLETESRMQEREKANFNFGALIRNKGPEKYFSNLSTIGLIHCCGIILCTVKYLAVSFNSTR